MVSYKINEDIYDLPEDKVESFLTKFPNAEKLEEPGKITPTTQGAVVEETAAPDTESKSEDGSLVSQDEFDASAELNTAGDLFKANLKRAAANLAEFPAFVNRLKFALGKAFMSDEEKEKLKNLSPKEQDAFAQAIGGIAAPGSINIGGLSKEGQEAGAKLRAEAEELEKNLVQYDSDITDTIFKEGNIAEGTTRLLTQVIGTLPSVMQAFIPGVGIPSIVAGSAAEASREAVYEKGKDINLRQQAYATGIGMSEGLLEIVTKRIGSAAFKNLIGKPKEVVKKTLLQTGTGIVKAGGAEGLSETGTLAINKFLESKYYNEKGLFEMDKQKWNEFWGEAGDTFLIGMATGKSIAGTGAGAGVVRNAIGDRSVKKTLEKANVKEVSEAFKNENITEDGINLSRNVFSERKLNEELNTKVNNGEITFNESNEIKLNFANAQAAIKLADNIKIAPSLINETVNLIQERNKLSNTVKQAGENKALVSEEANRLKEIDTRLAEISKENISIKLEERIEKLEKPIKEPGSLMADPLGIITAADKLRQVKLEEAKQTKISNEVQDIYNKKGAEGAFEIIEKFKPITNKLVRKRREAPNYDEQLLRDEIETGERGILDLIRDYNPDSGVPLSGYINKFLPARAIEASKRILGEEFTQDVTEIRESKIELDDTTQETIDFLRTEPEAKEQLRDIAGITKENIQKDATEILKGKLPGIVEKSGRDQNEILTAINNASKLKISDSVLEEMGGNFNNTQEQNSRFATFLDTNYDAIIKSIPDAVKNKLPVFEKIDTGKREQTKEGKKIFEYKTPTKEQMLSFYTEGGLTTLRARKLKLSDILAQEIGKDAIAEVLADPNIQKEFLERQELLGKEIPQDAIPRLLQRIDRTIEKLQQEGDKFKGVTTIGVSPKLITDSLIGGLKIIKKGLEAGLSFQKALAKGIDYIKRKLKSEAAGDVIAAEIQTIEDLKKLTDEQLQKVMEDVQEAIDTEVELGKQDKAYFKDLKSLNIKETLDLSRLKFNINESKLDKIKSNRLIKGTPKEKQDFINRGKEVVSSMPKEGRELFIDGKNTTLLQGLLGFHYRYVGSGQAPILYDNISTKQPTWISDKTKELFKNLPKKIVTANDLKSVQKAINEAKTKEEKIQIAKDNLNKIKKHQKDVDAVFYATQSLLSDYVYSAKNEQDLINKIDYVTKIKSTNSNNVNGDRALVKVNGFYIGPVGKKVKLEHVKTSAEQSIQGLQQILSGNIDTNITADFEGVYGFEFDSKGKSTFGFSKIDKAGKTNVSQYYRFSNPKDAANYILAEYNFEGSIANKNAIKILNDIKKDKARNENIKEIYNKKDLNKEFNEFLEKSTGIGAEKVFSKAKAEARAKTVRRGFGDYFVPPGAEDFAGLMHKTLAKGKEGEKQLKFYQDNLYTPYNVANENITRERAAMFEDFRALKKNLSNVPKKLKQLTKGGDFTYDQAVRVYMWNKLDQKVPGLSESDLKSLVKEVNDNKELNQFANELLNITKGDGYAKPENNWMGGNIATDLMGLMNSTKRSKHLEVWQNNVDQIFSEQNLNKLEAAYGKEWVTNLKKTLERMKIGSNRKWGGDKVLQSYLDWVNGSVGAIMFLNTRSAVLQTISNINYLNFSDNNPLQAAKAFANQKQYWADFKTIFNSDYLQERRGGNKINVNESELALAAEKGGIQGAVSLLLNKGFIFTKIADSFAIASGGATMYRNRINKYIKDGLSEKEATEKAFIDFKAITEETQQSSRPDRISEQQASNAGRLFLAFANTPMQYNRIIKKNAQDLVAGRGNKAEKISKIIYYSTIQNLIFNAMQKALFALAFSEDDEEEKEIEKYSQIANGMADSLLRGMGMTGNAAVAVKNVATDIANRMDKPRPNFQDAAWKALTISPPIYSKVSKLRGAGYSLGYTTPENIFEPKLDNPALSAGANIISATTNIPLDRAIRKAQNIEAAMSDEVEWWQSAALLMGWGSWELGIEQPKKQTKKKTKSKNKKFGSTKTLKLK